MKFPVVDYTYRFSLCKAFEEKYQDQADDLDSGCKIVQGVIICE